jgi:hypothetical protein
MLAQGNCTKEPQGNLDPQRTTKSQCHVKVKEDFLEQQVPSLWLADLYVEIVRDTKNNHSTFIGVHGPGSTLYMTDVVFKGDHYRARGVDLLPGRKAYARGVPFRNSCLPLGFLLFFAKMLFM